MPLENKFNVDFNRIGRVYDTDYVTDMPIGNFYVLKFNRLPKNITSNNTYNTDIPKKIEKMGYSKIWDRRKIIDVDIFYVAEYYIKDDNIIAISFRSSKISEYEDDNPFLEVKDKIPDSCNVSIYYTDYKEVEPIIKILNKNIKIIPKGGKISLVISKQSGLSTIDYAVTPVEMDIEKHYGKAFIPVHKKILEQLNEDQGKGLVLLHGIPGTGKTTYIRYIATQLNKQIIFIPPYLTENISGPDFIPFLLQNKNSILIIEDAEKVILDRDSGSSNRQGVSNILNLTDGLLSDCLNIQVIATFNTTRDMIDKALLRKGRLIGEWKFDKLSVTDSNNMLKHINKEYVTSVPMSLTDIYNVDEVEYASSKKPDQSPIGFNR